ncbi:hypothetical protein EJJ36_14275 [Acinetobacter junii]|jgi:uncharacterized protein YceK|uniref:hypothetical protein n=1 Tax=Acinetobacter TaxID=469 RepID=UPI000F7E4F74|nr:hypothetical protein [Acinetobacter junii]RTE44928.1 hypothetical protein EJJ36_14275 [Acinetobacter junii]UAA86796.1 hypothetical protein H2787_18470 [Acinetobacter baumannii]
MKYLFILIGFSTLLMSGCATTNQHVLDSQQSQVQLRNIQTRTFDTTDKSKTMRAVMSTLQDLGFVLDEANETLGTVSGTKLDGYTVKMTVSVRPVDGRIQVRANGQYNLQPITKPEIYQSFFSALDKSMFLQSQSIN